MLLHQGELSYLNTFPDRAYILFDFHRFYGEKSLKVATAYHLLARAHSCRGEFRLALQNEKEAFAVYKQKLGEEHEKTKESSDCLKHLTHQAVIFQKKMNEIERTNTAVSLPTLQAMLASVRESGYLD